MLRALAKVLNFWCLGLRGEDEPKKAGNDVKVAAPEAFWFLNESEKPLQTVLAYPARSLANASRVKIKCCADTDHDFGVEELQKFCHEAFLLRSAEADPKNVWLC